MATAAGESGRAHERVSDVSHADRADDARVLVHGAGEPAARAAASSPRAAASAGARQDARERIVRLNDTSPEGLREKAQVVIAEMEQRLELLGFSWEDAVTTQAYTVQNIGHLVGELIAARGACTGRPRLDLCAAAGGRWNSRWTCAARLASS